MGWTPRDSSREILDRAMVHVRSVPYIVSLRWLFYRLLQDGLYHHKAAENPGDIEQRRERVILALNSVGIASQLN